METDQTPAETKDGRTDPVEAEDMIPVSEFKHVKDDLHRWKEEARKAAEKLKEIEEKEMREKQQWKEYAAMKEKEAEEHRSKYEGLQQNLQERAKISKVREEALKLGLRDEAIDDLEMFEFSDVIVETTSTGRVNVIGAKSAAERVKLQKPHWFNSSKVPNVNSSVPTVQQSKGGKVTMEDLTKLEAEARKSGDYTEYKKKLMELKQR
jgi:flagellar biosynthesis GTPase FlhF